MMSAASYVSNTYMKTHRQETQWNIVMDEPVTGKQVQWTLAFEELIPGFVSQLSRGYGGISPEQVKGHYCSFYLFFLI